MKEPDWSKMSSSRRNRKPPPWQDANSGHGASKGRCDSGVASQLSSCSDFSIRCIRPGRLAYGCWVMEMKADISHPTYKATNGMCIVGTRTGMQSGVRYAQPYLANHPEQRKALWISVVVLIIKH